MAASSSTSRIAVVTGANRGIGNAIATGLAELGLTVVLGGRSLAAAEAAAKPLQDRGLKTVAHQLDITDQASVDVLVRDVDAQYGRLDALVNNAAINEEAGGVETPDLDRVRAILEVNVIGSWRMAAAVLPLMKRNMYGRIVNVSSGSGSFGGGTGIGPGSAAYGVSKAGLHMLTAKLAASLAGTGILVNAATPGWVRTDMGGPNAPLSPEEGADTPIFLATLPDDGPNGGLFRKRERIPW